MSVITLGSLVKLTTDRHGCGDSNPTWGVYTPKQIGYIVAYECFAAHSHRPGMPIYAYWVEGGRRNCYSPTDLAIVTDEQLLDLACTRHRHVRAVWDKLMHQLRKYQGRYGPNASYCCELFTKSLYRIDTALAEAQQLTLTPQQEEFS